MDIRTEKRLVRITLEYWEGGRVAEYQPDCFDDLEVQFRLDHWDAEADEIRATEAEVKELAEWWADEAAVANAGELEDDDEPPISDYWEHGEWLTPLSDDELSNGDGWAVGFCEVDETTGRAWSIWDEEEKK